MATSRIVASLVAIGGVLAAGAVSAVPRSGVPTSYSLKILGFNDGVAYRVKGAEADAVLLQPRAVLFRFSTDWTSKRSRGDFVKVQDVVSRYPNRPPSELVEVFRFDIDRDGDMEVLLVPRNDSIDDSKRYAPTLLDRRGGKYRPMWAGRDLPGERYEVIDARDLNKDGFPEVLLTGKAGSKGFYVFHTLIGHSGKEVVTLPVEHLDTLHYLDLDGDSRVEVVVGKLIGRRGQPVQWTHIDHLHQWDGIQFSAVDRKFPRYFDEAMLPNLVRDLVDNYDSEAPILMEKVDAIRDVRKKVRSWTTRPRGHQRKVVRALSILDKGNLSEARRRLEGLVSAFPYATEALLGLARIHASLASNTGEDAEKHWGHALEYAGRALTVEPRDRWAWWLIGMAYAQTQERSAAVGSWHLAVRVTGPISRGIAFLKERRGEPGMDAKLQEAIDEAIAALTKS